MGEPRAQNCCKEERRQRARKLLLLKLVFLAFSGLVIFALATDVFGLKNLNLENPDKPSIALKTAPGSLLRTLQASAAGKPNELLKASPEGPGSDHQNTSKATELLSHKTTKKPLEVLTTVKAEKVTVSESIETTEEEYDFEKAENETPITIVGDHEVFTDKP